MQILSKLSLLVSKVHSLLLVILPLAIILSLIDFRFHNYFWSDLDRYRFFEAGAYFDFSSFFSYFLILFVVVSIISVCLRAEEIKSVLVKNKFATILVFIFGSLLFFSILLSYLNYESIYPYIKSFKFQVVNNYIQPFILFFFLFLTVNDGEKFRLLKQSFILTFAVFGLLIIVQSFAHLLPGATHDFLGRSLWPYIDPFLDLRAESANWLAYLFGPLLLLVVVEFGKIKRPAMKIMNAVALLVFGVVIFLTQSYTAILVLLFLVGIFAFLKLPRRAKIISLFVAPVILGLFVLSQWDSPKLQILFGTADYSKPNSIVRRLQIYDVNEFALKNNFVSGLGPGNYQSYFLQNQNMILESPVPVEEVPPHPHNLVINFWSDLGILGLVLILLIYGWGIVGGFLNNSNLYFLVLAYPLLHGLVDTPYTLEENSLIFWILVYFAIHRIARGGEAYGDVKRN
ncbi:hypothetical protein CVV38_00530 [Candidatus Peregrinibacteria bacterium HGW-Peregrinibacteria-1]|jgi:O-antigen ligase|nr:MAG: hypothetical protein CVV38_00530 [Candidatus Peregrinibacteria bacterium HGW-Peregrinibacteria-1]